MQEDEAPDVEMKLEDANQSQNAYNELPPVVLQS